MFSFKIGEILLSFCNYTSKHFLVTALHLEIDVQQGIVHRGLYCTIGAGIPNMFWFWMVERCLDVEWFWFWMSFQNWTAQLFQIWPNTHHLGFLSRFYFQMVWTIAITVAMVLIILLPNHPKSEHQIVPILNGFWIWMYGIRAPTVHCRCAMM